MKNISVLDKAGMNLCKLFLVDTTLTYSGIQQKFVYQIFENIQTCTMYIFVYPWHFENHVFVTKSTTITVSM